MVPPPVAKNFDDDFKIVGPAVYTEYVEVEGRRVEEAVQVHQVHGPIVEQVNGVTSYLLWDDKAVGHCLQTDVGTQRKPWRRRGHNEQGILLAIAAKKNLQLRELREAGVVGKGLDPELPDYLGGGKPVMRNWCVNKSAESERMQALRAKLFAGTGREEDQP
mmetsp:Transcript_57889/g.116052  ORF Transcript_57889/g.116052 Transcript_57889/m.116052 type:complete len:162 (-) Transcript_57889:106-591(-)